MPRTTLIRIFIGYANDARTLVGSAESVIHEVQKEVRRQRPHGLTPELATFNWDADSSSRTGGQQATIDPALANADIGVFLFHGRVGAVTRDEVARMRKDGRHVLALFPSGRPPELELTEVSAAKAWAELLAYREALSASWTDPAGAAVKPLPPYADEPALRRLLHDALLDAVAEVCAAKARPTPKPRSSTRPATTPASRAGAAAGLGSDEVWNAFLLVADTVRFSEQDHEVQVDLMRHLLAGLDGHEVMRPGQGRPSEVLSTGDGFIVAMPTEGPAARGAQFCDLAATLVNHAARFVLPGGGTAEIRIGLHVGELNSNVANRTQAFAVGTGLNHCARIADLAAPSQVLASEEIVEVLLRRSRRMAAQFYPRPPDEAPFALAIKHGRKARFRMLVGEGLSERPPPKSARAQQIGLHLENALEIVAGSLVDVLQREGETAMAAVGRLKPRVTVWEPVDGHLRGIDPRLELQASGVRRLGPSHTVWPLHESQKPASGPLAEAFHSNRPRSLIDLPDPEESARYAAAWREAGVGERVVAGFSRPSRSVLVLPLSLFGAPPVGVLCIDLIDPLSGLGDRVNDLLEGLQLRSGYFLAALLHLRAA